MAVQKTAIPPSQGPLASRSVDNQRKNALEKTRDPRLKTVTRARNTSAAVAAAGPRVNPGTNGNNTDERLRAAKERREENQKLAASRKQDRLERERRAKHFHQQQLQERQKKLLEQREKEERRRTAVEEKRKQKLQEEKERNESTVRRTQEKSQKAVTQSLNPRGRKPTKNAARAPPLTPWEKNLVNRLVTPTCSYLARSKSAGYQSDDEVVHICRRAVSFFSTATASPAPQKPKRPSPSPRRSVAVAQKQEVVKTSPRSPANNRPTRNVQTKTTSPSPDRTPRRSVSRQSPPLQPELPSVPEEDAAICIPALAPGNSRPVRTGSLRAQESSRSEPRRSEVIGRAAGDGTPQTRPAPRPQAPEVKPPARSVQKEEASRLLAEKRKQARLLREQEEQERLEREEAERRHQEEVQRRLAEERALEQAEAQRLVEEKRRREEEEQRRAEEERAQAMREAALLQKQREEELLREKAREEKLKQERAVLAEREDAERQVRRKRLEEIMRRTRRSDSPDTKPAPARALPCDPRPKENTVPVQDLNDDVPVPVVAFKERRSLRTLTGLEDIQSHQRAEVIS